MFMVNFTGQRGTSWAVDFFHRKNAANLNDVEPLYVTKPKTQRNRYANNGI